MTDEELNAIEAATWAGDFLIGNVRFQADWAMSHGPALIAEVRRLKAELASRSPTR